MLFKSNAVVVALAATLAAPAPAWAFGGGPGCSDLPELYRAYGALQGLSTCGLTIEQASRIVAAYNAQQGERPPRARNLQQHELQP